MSVIRERIKEEIPEPDAGAGASIKTPYHHEQAKHGVLAQLLRMLCFVLFFTSAVVVVNTGQYLASPLYLINKDYYYAYMSYTKQCFGLIINLITQWFSPTIVRISGDRSVKGQLKVTPDGRLVTTFAERLVLIANHQIYTDWLYLWWTSYTSDMHGHLYIILKESLKYIPIIGPGMMFYGFIFLARKWAKDKPRFKHALERLKSTHYGRVEDSRTLNPAWLLIFPEGTNLCRNGRETSKKWADKVGIADLKHQMLPRSTGLRFCMQELRGTLDWIYDCTIAYEGIPDGAYGEEIYTLRSIYFQGLPPKSVNMYWRRFALSSIPLDDAEEFEVWLRQKWIEKDALLEQYQRTGRFPADESDGAGKDGFIETSVRTKSRFEILLIYAPLPLLLVLLYGFCGIYNKCQR